MDDGRVCGAGNVYEQLVRMFMRGNCCARAHALGEGGDARRDLIPGSISALKSLGARLGWIADSVWTE